MKVTCVLTANVFVDLLAQTRLRARVYVIRQSFTLSGSILIDVMFNLTTYRCCLVFTQISPSVPNTSGSLSPVVYSQYLRISDYCTSVFCYSRKLRYCWYRFVRFWRLPKEPISHTSSWWLVLQLWDVYRYKCHGHYETGSACLT